MEYWGIDYRSKRLITESDVLNNENAHPCINNLATFLTARPAHQVLGELQWSRIHLKELVTSS